MKRRKFNGRINFMTTGRRSWTRAMSIRTMAKKNRNKEYLFVFKPAGMTLPELLMAAAILAVSITGILVSYLRCMELNEISQNMSKAVKAAASRVEQIRNTAFTSYLSTKTTYHQVPFDIAGLDGKGVSYVDDTNPDLLLINVCVSWKQKNGRLFGQDADLDGQIDAGEDPDNNGMLDSPVQLTTYFFER